MKPKNLDDIGAFGDVIENNYDQCLQRTKEWLVDRGGKFTGSEFFKLMNCGRSTAKQPWGGLAKLIDFGATAERYIYNVGQERNTGILSMETKAQRMEHGKESEPLLIAQLIKDGVITDFQEKGFEKFYEFGGASVDGVAIHQAKKMAMELKCTTSWDGHYARMYEPVHEKHGDFWQIQGELLAVGLSECLYVVASPMQVEVYDIQIVKASPIHQKQILERCKIADHAISLWPKHGYKKSLEIACAEYKPSEVEEVVKEIEAPKEEEIDLGDVPF